MNAHTEKYVPSSKTLLTWLFAFTGLFALRIPFIAHKHMKDDAYIFLKCSKTLLESGTLGFNPGEPVSSCTSIGYVLYLTAQRWVVGESVIDFLPYTNTLVLLLSLFFLVFSLYQARHAHTKDFLEDRTSLLLFISIGASAYSMIASYSGMETPLVMAAIAAVAVCFTSEKKFASPLLYVCSFFLAFIRPDAFLIVLPFSLFFFFKPEQRSKAIGSGLLAVCGLICFLLFNELYFGSWIPQTVIGKASTYEPDKSISAIFKRFLGLSLSPSIENISNIVRTHKTAPLSTPIFLLQAWGIILLLKNQANYGKALLQSFLLLITGYLLAYAYGGVVFPWYTWPLSILLSLLAYRGFLDFAMRISFWRKSLYLSIFAAFVLSSMGLQYLQAVKRGEIMFAFKSEVVNAIKQISGPGDRLMLEPAGFIPYHTDLYTIDEVGLVSPSVTEIQQKIKNENQASKKNWWIAFLQENKPEILVERNHILEGKSSDGRHINEKEYTWFLNNYKLVQKFDYEQHVESHYQGWRRKIRLLGDYPQFLVYRLIEN